MVSTSGGTDSPSNEIKKAEGEEGIWALPSKLSQLKKQIQASRVDSIREKVTNNGKNLEVHTSILLVMASSKKDISITDENDAKNMLSYRISNSLCKLSGSDSGSVEKEIINSQEELSSSTILFGNNNNGKSLVRLIKLPFIEKIPPYTTWIFLNRNQRMAEDQSVVGRRQIYYDQYGSEALICSDSEEEVAEPEEEKHEFSDGEDQILWKALQEHGLNQEVFDILRQFVDATSSEIEERYELLLEKYEESNVENSMSSGDMESHKTLFLEKTLSTALDSFDNLFCRRCLIFDCRLHGCSQSLISPSEKHLISLELEEYRKPCSDQCYLRGREDVQNIRSDMSDTSPIETVPSAEEYFLPLASAAEKSDPVNERTDLTVPAGRDTDLIVSTDKVDACRIATHVATIDTDLRNSGKRKVLKHESLQLGTTKHGIEKLLVSADKKQKKLPSSDVVSVINEGLLDVNLTCRRKFECRDSGELNDDQLQRKAVSESTGDHTKTDETEGNENSAIEVYVVKNSSNSRKGLDAHGWNPIEKDLYLKGIEIFGKNSCLIARNLLSGLKTCMEVSNYMFNDDAAILSRPMFTKPCLDDNVTDPDYMEQEMPKRTRIWRRRGRARKLKYTWKSAGHPSSRKRIADGKQQSCKQYSPCGCQLMCGKQCPCLDNGTCCEKYCGCSKSCKNRFRGCHCAKSQCRSRQCPCFAAGRECDPDVCRNCWVSCGDGSLGEPPTRGEDYQCGNMKLLLKQQKRILLGKSDVAGWGAFIKNPVNKHDYLGEYTGELISHKEADKRGKIYDRANSSFLFDLNDQYVLDAYRKGDELKFANHSSNPNCYAKVMLVAGDHRVGIFANEHIEASEELFYDYRYGPDQAPAWARKPEGSRREDSTVSHGRAQKIA